MKVIISSKTLYHELEKFDLENETIEAVRAEHELLILVSQNRCVEIQIRNLSYDDPRVDQFECRWDFLKNTLKYIPEQPIVLNINQNRLQAVFNF